MKTVSFFLLMGAMLLAGCVREIALNPQTVARSWVLVALPEVGQPLTIYLNRVSSLVDGSPSPSTCFRSCTLWINDSLAFSRSNGCDTLIEIPARIRGGDFLKLEIATESGILAACDTVPSSKPVVKDGDYWSFPNEERVPVYSNSFVLVDRPVEKNHYAFQSFGYSPLGIEVMQGMQSNNITLQKEGDIGYLGFIWPLCDLNLEDVESEIDFQIAATAWAFSTEQLDLPSDWLRGGERSMSIRIYETSPIYYRFLKSWIRHQHNRQTGNYRSDDVLEVITRGEPSFLYSNVEGGLGIFAARSAPVYLKLQRR